MALLPRHWFRTEGKPAAARRLTRPLAFDILEDRVVPSTNVVRASTDSNGGQLVGSSFGGSISGDGRFVVFTTSSPTLGGALNQVDVYVKDLQSGVTTRVSSDSNGNEANANSSAPVISRDGHWVAFVSSATNLVSDGKGGGIFLKNLTTHQTMRVVAGASDAAPAISADGHFVAFQALDNTLVAGDNSTHIEVFRKDTTAGGTITRVSTDASGNAAFAADGDATLPAISDNGNIVAFQSLATNLVTGDTNGNQDIFVKNLTTKSIVRADTGSGGTQATGGDSQDVTISGDGSRVAFESFATNLIANPPAMLQQVFLKDLNSGATTLVSSTSAGVAANMPSFLPQISGNGAVVAFLSDSNNLVATAGIKGQQVYTKNVGTGLTTLVSATSQGVPGDMDALSAFINNDGSAVSFSSVADNLVAKDTNLCADIFVVTPAAPPPPLPANQAPVISFQGAAPSLQRGSGFIFTGSTAITLTDADGGNATEQTTLSVDAGTLKLGSTSGLVSVSGDGTSSIVLQGSTAAMTSALNGLVYLAPQDLIGAAHLTVVTNDLGNTGSGGAKTTQLTVELDITDVKPVLAAKVASAGVKFNVAAGHTLKESGKHSLLTLFKGLTGDHLKIHLVKGPKFGKLVLHQDGSFTYTPRKRFHGKVTFQVAAFDGFSLSKPLTVTLTVR